MRHLDLFSGIGGFAYAVDQVFGDVEHIFCDNDKFCQQVLNKHWPESEIFDDIRAITADSIGKGRAGRLRKTEGQHRLRSGKGADQKPFLLTGGFPCQPFSAAGLRRGTSDDRHLWPEMLRVIRLTQPEWVIAENVRGLLNQNEGVVLEQVCADLEAEGYAVQPLIIPAIAVNAPHRRDRIWFVAHSLNDRQGRTEQGSHGQAGKVSQEYREKDSTTRQSKRTDGNRETLQYASDTRHIRQAVKKLQAAGNEQYNWSNNWLEVATELCGVDDGLPAELDGFELTKSKHRQERLKALGNAIVPEIAMEIMRGIQLSADYK